VAETSTLNISLDLPGVTGFDVVAAHFSEGLSVRSYAEIEVATGEDLDWNAAVGQMATLTIAGLETRVIKMKMQEACFLGNESDSMRWSVRLYDAMFPLSLTLDTYKFRNLSAQQIVEQILSEHRVVHRWKLRKDPPVRKYCAQYRESDLAFVERLLEFEGIWYSVEDDASVVLCDWSPGVELVRGGAEIGLIEAAQAMSRGEVGVHEARRGARVAPGRVTLADHNWKRPDVPLRETAWGDAQQELERYEYLAGYRQPARGNDLAKLRVEAFRSEATFLSGKSNVLSFAPGNAFKMSPAAGDAFGGDWLLVRVDHRMVSGAYAKEKGDTAYENRFDAIPLGRPYRPPLKTPRPVIAGTHTAMARGPAGEEIHTDKYGRFRAQFHWDREGVGTDDDSRWLRILQETSSSMVLARTGWELFVTYIGGDPDRPIGIGRAINAEMAPTYDLPGNMTRMSMRTPSSPAKK
jgi:type VI secretion system secreted protein VgrG